jgi:hypothetical protein
MTTTTETGQQSTGETRTTNKLFSVLTGLTTLVVVLQGLWAGIFLEHDGARNAAAGWIDIHARGGDISIVLALAAAVTAFVTMRARRSLWLGALALTVLLVVEAYVGGLIRDDGQDALTAVHVPLAMVILALAVWLPVHARSRGRR